MNRTITRTAMLLLVACAMPTLQACSGAGIAIRESLGQAKREQLVDRVEDARDEQTQAKEQFATTLDDFKALTRFDGGDLEALYRRLDNQLGRSRDQAEDVSDRIRDVERVADAMFKEWERELDDYTSDSLRLTSEARLEETRLRYEELLRVMKRAESSMQPVLDAFADQVLFLKHNLNARAIASLEDNVAVLETEIARLIEEMERSITEADHFIGQLDSPV